MPSQAPVDGPTPVAWAHSSVSTFGVGYVAPVSGLDVQSGIEGMVEGSAMSQLRNGEQSMQLEGLPR